MSSDVDAVVWVADGTAYECFDYGTRLIERLTSQGRRVLRRDLTAPDGTVPHARIHILSGGATSVNERSGWMTDGLTLTRALVDSTQAHGHRVLGICLGAQMIAEVLWPGRIRGADSIEVGLTEVQWNDQGEGPTVVPAFHYEEVDSTAVTVGGGEIIAANEHSPVQGFQYGSNVFGVQFHPEFTLEDIRLLVEYHQKTIEEFRGSMSDALDSVDQFESALRPDLLEALLGRVMET